MTNWEEEFGKKFHQVYAVATYNKMMSYTTITEDIVAFIKQVEEEAYSRGYHDFKRFMKEKADK